MCYGLHRCSAVHAIARTRKAALKTFPYRYFSTFARSVNYTRVIQANDQLLTPENWDIDVPTRVVPGRGTHGLKIGTSR